MKIILVFLFVYIASSLTYPLHMHRYTVHDTKSNSVATHLKHLRRTYHILSRLSFFSIQIKVNGYQYHLTLDTGSSDTFIKGQNLTGLPQKKYSCPRCMKQNKKYVIGYLDGFFDTYLNQFEVQLGEHKFNQNILVAYTVTTKNFEDMGGIIGLSFQQIAHNPHPTFIQTLINQKIIDSYSFGVQFDIHSNVTSFITFGQANYTFIEKGHQLQFFDLDPYVKHYTSRISGIIIGNSKLPVSQGLFDTGNTCLSIPARYESNILRDFNTMGNKCEFILQKMNNMFSQLSCNVTNFQGLPNVGFYRDDRKFEVEKQLYIDTCKKHEGFHECVLFIESVRWGGGAIIGDTIFQRYYAYFDLTNRRIGLARNRNVNTFEEILKRKFIPVNE